MRRFSLDNNDDDDTDSLSLSLSLSHTHTHTHTQIQSIEQGRGKMFDCETHPTEALQSLQTRDGELPANGDEIREI